MTILIATPKASNANSYLTVARADEILRQRLYASAWNNATSTPDAEGYLVNSALGVAIGQVLVPVDTGTGTFTAGSKIKFAGHSTEYTVQVALSAPGSLSILPALTSSVADNEAISRTTPNQREQALIWATELLDAMMDWKGIPTNFTGQALRWPRYGPLNRDGTVYLNPDVIPLEIEQATAELALALLGRDLFATPELLGLGFQSAKVGSIEVVVDNPRGAGGGHQEIDLIPSNIYAMVAHLGDPISQAGHGTKTHRLERA